MSPIVSESEVALSVSFFVAAEAAGSAAEKADSINTSEIAIAVVFLITAVLMMSSDNRNRFFI